MLLQLGWCQKLASTLRLNTNEKNEPRPKRMTLSPMAQAERAKEKEEEKERRREVRVEEQPLPPKDDIQQIAWLGATRQMISMSQDTVGQLLMML